MKIKFYCGANSETKLNTENVIAASEWEAEKILRAKYENFTGIAYIEYKKEKQDARHLR
jgi:hypothetical protein